MKEILIITDWYLPAYKAGGPIRSLYNIVNILRTEYKISILTGDRDLGDEKPFNEVELGKWLGEGSNLRIYYIPESKPKYKLLKEILLDTRFDFIYLNSMFSYYYSILPLCVLFGISLHKKIIFSPRGMLQAGALDKKFFRKKIYLFFFKPLSTRKKILFHATDLQEKKDIEKHLRVEARNIRVIPNPVSNVVSEYKAKDKIEGKLKLVFISVISEKKNLTYLLDIFHKLTNSEIELDIYGVVKDRHYFEEFLSKSQSMPKNVTINYKGSIPNEQVIKHIQNYHFFILPTLGENFGHAIFESVSAGRPVIISDKTPWRDLEKEKAGWDIPLENKDNFIEILNKCSLMDQQEYNKWCLGAFTFANRYKLNSDLTEEYFELFS